MSSNQSLEIPPAEREAWLGLWAVPGVGRKTLEALRVATGGLVGLAEAPVQQWVGALKLPAAVRESLGQVQSVGQLADRVREKAAAAKMTISFIGDANYPSRLAEVADAPPLLFSTGPLGSPRRRVAMVGSRHPDAGFLLTARAFASEVAAGGVGVVSGAAEGVDRACHLGAVDQGQETWAFLGSALDQLDPAQAQLVPHLVAHGAVCFSELPPGVRADRSTFPRRNRLISGASDAVLVLRAGTRSGALYTSSYARAQGRPVLALPGDARNEAATGCNLLIQKGEATLCLGATDVWAAVRAPSPALLPQPMQTELWKEASPDARVAYEALSRSPSDFDQVLAASKLKSGKLSSALCELELMGLVVQHPGKRYEKI